METSATSSRLGGWTSRAAAGWAAAIIIAILLAQALRLTAEALLQERGDGQPTLLLLHFVPTRVGALAIAMPAALVVALVFSRASWLRFAVATILAGSVSNNLVERLMLGRITTYVRVAADSTPVNVADVLIAAGCLVFLLGLGRWLLAGAARTKRTT